MSLLRAFIATTLLVFATSGVSAADLDTSSLPCVTHHHGVFNGQSMDYTATVSATELHDASGAATARFVSTSYVREGIDAASRPVLFLFNGGPSSSSSTLHMVGLGPQRLVIEQNPAKPAPSPPRTEDNTFTVLDVADLVFLDPAETGFSRVLAAGKREAFYTSDGDANAAAQFVESWSHANGRADSPKFVLGESYGTIRAALMAGALAKTMPLDGVYLFGQAINMVETSQRAQNVLGYTTNLPALAAVAAYHGKASLNGKSMSSFIDHTYEWSMGEYLQALLQGHDLPLPRQQSIAQHLQQLTGIDAKYYLEHNLVITKMAFARELLKDRGQMVASYDARYTGPAPKPGERGADPFESVRAPIMPLLTAYMKDTLAVTLPMEQYRDFAPGAGDWVYTPTGGAGGPFWDYDFPGVLDQAFAVNPRFYLVIGTGIYDLTTTAGPARYLVTKSNYPRDRVALRLYAGGHMAYTNEPALAAFTADVRAWLTHSALPPPMKLSK